MKTYPHVHINEELMREGMQIEAASISVDDKIRLLNALSKTGIRRIVAGSFASPKYTPQMANVEEVIAGFTPQEGVTYTAAMFNAKSLERASAFASRLSMDPGMTMGRRTPMLYGHLCDTFVRRNFNMTREQEVARWTDIVAAAVEAGDQEAAIGVGAAFGSNFEGGFNTQDRMAMLRIQHELWSQAGLTVNRVAFTDPMAWVKPWEVEEQLRALREEWPDITHIYLHLHDARGLALVSAYEALRILDERYDLYLDTTAGGIGGCPYCGTGRATGMIATEDLVNMLEELGIDTGIDLAALIRVVWMLEEIIGRLTPGSVSHGGPHPHGDDLYDPNLPFVETHDEARHFLLGPQVVEHQIRPWLEPIPRPRSVR